MKLSISQRLAAMFAVASFVMLAVIGVALHGLLKRELERHQVTELQTRWQMHQIIIAKTGDAEHWPAGAVMRRFASACRRLEHRLLPEFSLLLVPSEADKVETVQAAPMVPAIVVPNTIPLVARPEPPKTDEIVFSGNLEYHPNISAVRFFRDRVWPILSKRWPFLKWRIVGRNHERLSERFSGDDRIRFTGPVDDAIAEMASARLAVVPVQVGSGTRVKIIEAWAAGLPVISTTIGAEGLPGIRGEHLLIADEPSDFARAVSSILEFPALGKTLGENGRALYESDLTWESAWRRLDASGL